MLFLVPGSPEYGGFAIFCAKAVDFKILNLQRDLEGEFGFKNEQTCISWCTWELTLTLHFGQSANYKVTHIRMAAIEIS